jgi:hypothetical protein
MTVYALVHYGYMEDYEILEIFSNWTTAMQERDKIRERERKNKRPHYVVDNYDVLSFSVNDDEPL